MMEFFRDDKAGGPVSKNKRTDDDDRAEPKFRTPDQAAAADSASASASRSKTLQPSNKKRFNPFTWWKQASKKQQSIALVVTGIMLIGLTALGLQIFQKDPPTPAQVAIAKKKEPPKPTTEASRLTGLQIDPELNKLPVTGVMIENSPDARPQAGLKDAGMVIEAVSEGGITRFLALYLEDKPDYIGPVRSVRPYYLDFVVTFDAAIAHAGGSGDALAQIKDQGIKDLDQFANSNAYDRVSSRFAPHNLFTSRDKLLELHNKHGFTKSDFTSWPRKEKESPAAAPTVNKIDFNMSRHLYNPQFIYDKASNSYLRNLAGQPHKDERSGQQISPKVVVAIITSRTNSGIYSVYQMTGKGNVMVFQDGGLVEGTWEKTDRKSQFVFKTPDGKPLAMNPGKTWVILITPGGVTHSP